MRCAGHVCGVLDTMRRRHLASRVAWPPSQHITTRLVLLLSRLSSNSTNPNIASHVRPVSSTPSLARHTDLPAYDGRFVQILFCARAGSFLPRAPCVKERAQNILLCILSMNMSSIINYSKTRHQGRVFRRSHAGGCPCALPQGQMNALLGPAKQTRGCDCGKCHNSHQSRCIGTNERRGEVEWSRGSQGLVMM